MVTELKKFDYHDCIRENLLRPVPQSAYKAEESISASKKWLQEAEKGMANGAFNSSVISSYLSMFHSSRAILIFDGFREKSHYCIARYLEEKYVKTGRLEAKWIELLDHIREIRHDSQYDAKFFATPEDAKSTLDISKDFLKRIRMLLDEIEKQRNA